MATVLTLATMGTTLSTESQDVGGSSLKRDNALEHWEKVEGFIKGKQVVLFLDYDGTLSPIADRPERAYMKDGMRDVLAEAAAEFTTAIVTGRSKDKVYSFVGLDDVFYAGSHGLEIQGPQEKPVMCQMAEDIRPKLEKSAEALHKLLGHIQGYEIEDNKFSLSVHYRHVPSVLVDEVHKIVQQYTGEEPEIIVRAGKKVLELRPKVNWNKGSAVNWILEELGLASREDVFPIYLGDDITDEDAFVALENRATGGMGVLVKEEHDPERPPETNASFSLRNPDEVQHFLARLVTYAKASKA